MVNTDLTSLVLSKMQYLTKKQKVHGENISMSSVPGAYTKTLKPFKETIMAGGTPKNDMLKTHPLHLQGKSSGQYGAIKDKNQPEMNLSGNTIDPQNNLTMLNQANTEFYKMGQLYQSMKNRYKAVLNMGNRR
jgi:flagellar basal body rod protein FlgB